MKNVLIPNPSNCTGCRVCELICSWTKEKKINPKKARVKVINNAKEGLSIPLFCLQCREPSCIPICPTQALTREENTGAIKVNENLCIGCKLCVLSCPAGSPRIDPETGAIMICDLCGGDPACVKFCRKKAIQWVPASRVDTIMKSNIAEKLIETIKNITV